MTFNKDDELIMAHLMGGANGLNFAEPQPSGEEIRRRVNLTLRYMIEIREQVAQWRQETGQFGYVNPPPESQL